MIEFFDISYDSLPNNRSDELFSLRKKTFKDRLDWMVNCEKNMEFDVYDNKDTTYIFGVYADHIICSLRFIETRNPNMITNTFKDYFNNLTLPEGNYIDASRFFVDKQRVQDLKLQQHPISSLLFLSMINYARNRGYEGIYAIVSHSMFLILQRSGWRISVVEKGLSEKNQNIYFINMPIDDQNQHILMDRINQKSPLLHKALHAWPLSFRIKANSSDQVQLNTEPDSMLSVSDT